MSIEGQRLERIRALLGGSVPADVLAQVEAEVRAAAEERAEIHRQFRSLATAGFHGTGIAIDQVLVDVDDGLLALFGYTREEVLGTTPLQVFTPASREVVLRNMAAGVEAPYQVEGVRKDGTILPLLIVGRTVDLGGRKARVSAFRDLSEQRRAQQDLAELQERFRSFADLVPVALAETDEHGRLTFLNRAGLALQGVTRVEDVRGLSVFDWVHPDDRARAIETFSRRLDPAHMSPVEYRLLRRGGEEFPGLLLGRPLVLAGVRRGIHAVIIDLSERKAAEEARLRLEAQVLHAQKLDSLGALAGGIAHDFNNLFGAMLGNVELAVHSLDTGADPRHPIEAIGRSVRRAAELTAQMMAYAGGGPLEARPVDLRVVVDEIVDLLGAGLSKRSRLTVDHGLDLPAVLGDAARLQQVVLNLVTNASEALRGASGNVAVSLWAEDLAEPQIVGGERVPSGTWVVLEVSDDGEGMDADTVARIFEPFFSTRFAGRGLGLAAALGIVRTHGGAIEVETTPGAGSTFRVWLPAAVDEPEPPGPEAEAPPWRGSGIVLVVDDEPDVREVYEGMLELSGFAVVSVGDGEEAVRLLRARGASFRAVVLDVTMPPPGGPEIYAALRGMGLTMPVIVTSGYPESDALADFPSPGPEGYLQKPFGRAALADALRTLIG